LKKSERIIVSVVAITLGVLLVAWRGDIIQVLMTVLGISLVVWAVLSLIQHDAKVAVLKLICGILSVAFGWLLVSAVAYVLATVLVLLAIYLTVDFFRKGNRLSLSLACTTLALQPIWLVLMGLFLFLNNGGEAEWAFVLTGVFTVLYGGTLLLDGFVRE